jgi:hypothetical protein
MSDSVRINGIQISWSSVRFKIDGTPYYGITAIEYGDGMERALAYGMGRHHAPRSRTRGKYTPKPFVVTGFTATARTIRQALAQRAGTAGIASVLVPILLQYSETADGPTITIEAFDCTLDDIEAGHDEGPDPLSEKLTFQPLRLKRDGVAMYDTSEAGA